MLRRFVYFSSKSLMLVMALVFIVMTSNVYAQTQVAAEATSDELINDIYERLKGDDLKDIYQEIDRLKEVASSQEGVEAQSSLALVLDYYFWLDDAEGIKLTVNEINKLNLPEATRANAKIMQDMYLFYAEMIEEADYGYSKSVFESCLMRALEQGDIYNQAVAYGMLGVTEAFFGNYYTAIEKMQVAIQLLDGYDDARADRIRVGIYLSFAYIYTSIDNTEKTVDYYSKVIEMSLKRGFAVDHGSIIYNTGFLLLQHQNFAEAERYFIELEKNYLEIGDPENLTYPYYALSLISYYRKDYEASLNWAEKAYVHGQNIIDFEGTLLQLMAENNAWLGNLDKAYEYLGKADNYFEEFPDYKGTVWEAKLLKVRSVIAHVEGRYDDSIKTFDEFHQAFKLSQNNSFSSDVESLTSNLFTRIDKQRQESELLRQNMALEKLNLEKQRYLNMFIAFLLFLLIGLVLFQLRWSRILKSSKIDAEQASRSKSEFLAQMSHELRTPLNAIIGFSEMMSKEVLGKMENKKYKDYVVLINQSGLHLLRIINDILDISKVESGKLELTESKFDLCDLIGETVETMQNRASRVGLKIENTAPPKCLDLFADRRIVKQVLFNIISNSVKFTESGGTISVSYKVCDSGEIILDISDNGQGMSPEQLVQALEPFGQVKQVLVQSHEGTGLGLPLVQAFMAMHQGSMNISSKLGEGTKVELMFPNERVLQ